MLEEKDIKALDMVFPLISAFLDRAIEYGGQPEFTEINTVYSGIVNKLLYGSPDRNVLN